MDQSQETTELPTPSRRESIFWGAVCLVVGLLFGALVLMLWVWRGVTSVTVEIFGTYSFLVAFGLFFTLAGVRLIRGRRQHDESLFPPIVWRILGLAFVVSAFALGLIIPVDWADLLSLFSFALGAAFLLTMARLCFLAAKQIAAR